MVTMTLPNGNSFGSFWISWRLRQLGTAEAKHALGLSMKDFEDALQAAAAVAVGADTIVTRNVSDFASSPVGAVAPGDFLATAPT
jgi:hypothetical protein